MKLRDSALYLLLFFVIVVGVAALMAYSLLCCSVTMDKLIVFSSFAIMNKIIFIACLSWDDP